MATFPDLKKRLQAEWPDNDIINFVFLGDSITAGYRETPQISLHNNYSDMFMVWLNRRFPTASLNLINAGVGGWGVREGLLKLDQQVITHHPDLVTICYGMNDFLHGVGYLSEFRDCYREIIDRLQAAGIARIIMMTTIPYHDGSDMGKKHLAAQGINQAGPVQQAYMEAIRDMAVQARLPLADVYSAWIEAQAGFSRPDLLYSNGINHPNDAGHAIIAKSLIEVFMACLD